jgi:glycerol-3-phosphate dehydrogenase subunit B
MEQGDLLIVKGTLSVIGFKGHLGFDARLVAASLGRFEPRGGPPVVAGEVALPAFGLETANSYALARALEEPGAAEALGKELRAGLSARTGAVLLPPVLGLAPNGALLDRVREAAGLPVAETLSDVPSVPGARLEAAMAGRLEASGISIVEGNVAGGGPGTPALVAGRSLRARTWVLATGRFVGGGITRKGALVEPVLGLPVQAAEGRESGVHLSRRPAQALTTRDRRASQPLLSAGLRAGADLRPLDERGRPVFDRLFVAGAVLGGHEQATDGTGLGVAILTGFLAGRMAAGEGSKTVG